MNKSRIEWTDVTWNPITGCSPISEGCAHCWAHRMANRLAGRYGYSKDKPFQVTMHPERLEEPLRWRKPRRVFLGSMTDLFHDEVSDEFLDRIFAVMALCPQHTFLVLSKRPNRMQLYLADALRPFAIQKAIDGILVDLATEPATEEKWRPVLGYEGLYEVSNHGRVRRIGVGTKGRRNPEGILRPRATRGGYQSVCLSMGAQVRQVRINRLVLEAFAGPSPYPGAEARHLNGEPIDNRIENLAWGSKKDNMTDASRHGTAGTWMRGRAKFAPHQIAEIRALRAKGLKLDDIAARYGTTRKHISAICLGHKYRPPMIPWPLPHVWLGITAEGQQRADERIPVLLETPAAVRFVSCEPLLGEISLENYLGIFTDCSYSPNQILRIGVPPVPNLYTCLAQPPNSVLYKKQLDWVIVGGETGPRARPMHPQWARDIRDQCQTAGIPFFMKQMSNRVPIPDDLMIREFPKVTP